MNGQNDRRNFLKTSAATATLAFPAVLKAAQLSKSIKVGLVGCGGRGTGAAAQALKADDYAELTAVADIDLERTGDCLARLTRVAGAKVKVEKDKQFVGMDAYQKVIENCDVVLLATPPGFRPMHVKAVIEAGKHLFCEKPISVDAPGFRSVIESANLATTKNLSIMSGFCWRYSTHIRETFRQMLEEKAIGDIIAYYATYYTNPVKPMPPANTRPPGISDTEWQVRNWYNFVWLCGDSLVEQAVHSVDKVAWAMGDKPPISCVATGGRQNPANGGNIYDHFAVNYLYPDNVRAFVASRQIEQCYNENSDYILGSKGSCTIGRGPNPRIEGEKKWSYEGAKNDMYQEEHNVLFSAIRRGQPINLGVRMANSTMLAIMGRMAAYTGQQVTWEQAVNSTEQLFPDKIDWKGSFTPTPTPIPGVTKLI